MFDMFMTTYKLIRKSINYNDLNYWWKYAIDIFFHAKDPFKASFYVYFRVISVLFVKFSCFKYLVMSGCFKHVVMRWYHFDRKKLRLQNMQEMDISSNLSCSQLGLVA